MLKAQPGKDILVTGSISIAQALTRAQLVDEFRLVICPVVLRQGRPLFSDADGPIDLALVGARTLDRGAVSVRYAPRPAATGEPLTIARPLRANA